MITKQPTIEDIYNFDSFITTPGVRDGLLERANSGDPELTTHDTDDGPVVYYTAPHGEEIAVGRPMLLAAGPSNTVSDAGSESIGPIPRNSFQEAIGKLGELIQSGADAVDFGVIGLPGVGMLTLKDLTVGDLGKVLQDISYGFYPIKGGNAATGGIGTYGLKDSALELANAAPVVGAATKLTAKTAVKGAKTLAPKAGEMILNATEKTGMPVRGLGIVEPNGKTLPIIAPAKVERQKNYKTWAEGADIKGDSGAPKVLYHATTHDFDTFSLERANAENHYGKAFYLTDSVDDANANYAGVGPDLKQRIELRSERLADEFADMDEQDVMDTIAEAGVDMKKYFADGKTFADLDSKQTNEVLMQVAEKELKGHDGMVMPVFAKMKNPVKVGTKDETVFSIETKFDDAGDVVDESGNGIDLINAIREVGDEYSVDVEEVIAKIVDGLYDGLRAGDADKIMRENIYDVYTPDGEYASAGQFISDVFQRMGFDGIEMNAEKYFGPRKGAMGTKITGMQGVEGAKHYILFDSKNIKSAIGNNGKFDPRDPNILHGVGIGAGTAGATMQDKEKK